ncbi:aldose 1-epimerase [Labrys wisconsinensis]|uniref:Aldose 1-epimerase n=1 Tax=Labrys wisconsinensis TaxID=425677 RepID=A0ABU0JI54_9HYPH|nr:aldose 1-epimerase [Labrys wisconsinensis]MDQ0473976.1 aldose 1-epimerase [Labrys wisconsinensis]
MAAISDGTRVIRRGPLSAGFAPEIGGSLAFLRVDHGGGAVDLMRPLGPEAQARRDPIGVAMFPMVPYANRIAGNSFRFAGRSFRFEPNNPPERFNVHGTGWRRPWQVTESGTDAIRLTLAVTDPALYSYEASQTFTLDAAGLAVVTAVVNRGAVPMPFGLGQHPWFPRDPGVTLRFAATHFWLEGPDGVPSDRIGLPPELDFAAGRELPAGWRNNCYGGWSGEAEIGFPARGLGLRITADPVFGHLMLYADPTKPFFCLEPQSHAACAFNRLDGTEPDLGVIVLQPGEAASGTLRFDPFVL